MLTTRRLFLLVNFLSFGIFLFAQTQGAQVLVLTSYQSGDVWTDSMVRTLVERPQPDEIGQLYLEYLDFRRNSDPLYPQTLFHYLQEKYRDKPLDLVMIADDDALNFYFANREQLFGSLPGVFMGINNVSPQRLDGQTNLTGVNERLSMAQTLDLALKLFPKTQKIYGIVDEKSPVSVANLALFRTVTQNYSRDYDIIELMGFDEEQAREVLPNLPPYSLVLRTMSLLNKNGGYISLAESMVVISEYSSAPVFTFWDFDLGIGAVGGEVISADQQTTKALELALQVLRGTPADDIPLVMESPNIPILDYEVLSRFDFDPAGIPPDAIVLNRPVTFYAQYRGYIWSAIVIFGVLALSLGLTVSMLFLRRRAEAALQESEAFYRAYVDNAPLGILLADSSGNYIDANPEASAMTGYSLDEFRTKSVIDLVDEEYKQEAQKLFSTLAENGRNSFEVPIRTKWGEFRWWNIAATELIDGCYLGFHEDITARKAAQEAAQVAIRAKTVFLANMSHEIRTPINGIMGMLQLLETTNMEYEQAEYVRIAEKSCNRLTRLLTDILDLSRIEAGKMEVHLSEFPVLELSSSIVELFQSMALENGLELRVSVDPTLPPTLVGDELRIQQILFNLVGNALKFTPEGRVEVVIGPGVREEEIYWVDFRVQDTGIGIAPEKVASLFEPFVQAESSYTRSYQGAGLGLSIVQKLVDLLQGTIEVESDLGEGTVFMVRLPFS